MKYRLSFYGAETRILSLIYRRDQEYKSIIENISKKMGGYIPSKYRKIIKEHASDAADMIIEEELSL